MQGGIDVISKDVISRRYSGKTQTYDQWHKELSANFNLGVFRSEFSVESGSSEANPVDGENTKKSNKKQ
jgi:hypothetical protein